MASFAQKGLLIVLYGLLALMIIFSFTADKGDDAYQDCIQKKCELKGQEHCTKFREINNCCLGAGGETVITGNQAECSFK